MEDKSIPRDIIDSLYLYVEDPKEAKELSSSMGFPGLEDEDYWRALYMDSLSDFKKKPKLRKSGSFKSKYYELFAEKNVFSEELIKLSADKDFAISVGRFWTKRNIKRYIFAVYKHNDLGGASSFIKIWDQDDPFNKRMPLYLDMGEGEYENYVKFIGDIITGAVYANRNEFVLELLSYTGHYDPAVKAAAETGNYYLLNTIRDTPYPFTYTGDHEEATTDSIRFNHAEHELNIDVLNIALKRKDYGVIDWLKTVEFSPNENSTYFHDKVLETKDKELIDRFFNDFPFNLYAALKGPNAKRYLELEKIYPVISGDVYHDLWDIYTVRHDWDTLMSLLDIKALGADKPITISHVGFVKGGSSTLINEYVYKDALEYIYYVAIFNNIYDKANLAFEILRKRDPRVYIPTAIAAVLINDNLDNLKEFYSRQKYTKREVNDIEYYRQQYEKYIKRMQERKKIFG